MNWDLDRAVWAGDALRSRREHSEERGREREVEKPKPLRGRIMLRARGFTTEGEDITSAIGAHMSVT